MRMAGYPAMVLWDIIASSYRNDGKAADKSSASTPKKRRKDNARPESYPSGCPQETVAAVAGEVIAPPEATGKGNPLPDTLHFHGDNTASICICRSGDNKVMRHMGRTYGVALSWIHSEVCNGRCSIGYINTKQMAADIFTKFYPKDKATTWRDVRKLIGMTDGTESYMELLGTAGCGHTAAVERMKRDKVVPTATTTACMPDPDGHQYLEGYNPFNGLGTGAGNDFECPRNPLYKPKETVMVSREVVDQAKAVARMSQEHGHVDAVFNAEACTNTMDLLQQLGVDVLEASRFANNIRQIPPVTFAELFEQ